MLISFTLASNVPAEMRPGAELAVGLGLALLYCYLGYGLRRRVRVAMEGAVLLTGFTAILTLVGFLMEGRYTFVIGFGVNVMLLGLVLHGLRRTRRVDERVGA